MLQLQPISYGEACEFIKLHHRHHLPPQGWKFGIAVNSNDIIVGVITVGRPVARHYDDGWTLEVTRCAIDGTKNAPSMLYGAARRAAFAMGYKRLITYTLQSEPGTSLFASGWKCIGSAVSYRKIQGKHRHFDEFRRGGGHSRRSRSGICPDDCATKHDYFCICDG